MTHRRICKPLWSLETLFLRVKKIKHRKPSILTKVGLFPQKKMFLCHFSVHGLAHRKKSMSDPHLMGAAVLPGVGLFDSKCDVQKVADI